MVHITVYILQYIHILQYTRTYILQYFAKYYCDKYFLPHKRKLEKMQKRCSIEKSKGLILAFYYGIAVSKNIQLSFRSDNFFFNQGQTFILKKTKNSVLFSNSTEYYLNIVFFYFLCVRVYYRTVHADSALRTIPA